MNPQNTFRLYIGTYTRKTSEGIYTCEFDAKAGELSTPQPVADVGNPTFLTMHPLRPWLFAACDGADETTGGKGLIAGYAVAPGSGALTPLGSASTRSGRACHVTIDQTGRSALFADYSNGTVGSVSIDADGAPQSLHSFHEFRHAARVNPARQEAAHAHSINLAPGNRFAYVPDLGGDRLYVFAFDADTYQLMSAAPAWIDTAPGAGPRHMTFHPHRPYALVINELDGTIVSYRMEPDTGVLEQVCCASTLPDDFDGDNLCADIHLSPDNRFVYGTNRGHDSIVVFAFTEADGGLELVQRIPTMGEHPRNFALDPTGDYVLVANQDSDNIVVFARDTETGMLTDTGNRATVSMPVCLTLPT